MENNNCIERIKRMMRDNNGYVTTKQINEAGIHRMYLSMMKKQGIIENIGNGIYIDKNVMEDSYYVLSKQLPNVVYSHMTALYFYGISPKAPNRVFDISVPNNYFNYKIKNHNVFYVDRKIFKLGITTIKTPMGNEVKAYDIERCICDIIRSKSRMDIEYVRYSIKQYLKMKNKDLNKLNKYAKKLGVQDKLIEYMELLYE